MKLLKYLISAIVAVVISVSLFESSIGMMLICFCGLNMILISSKREMPSWKKSKVYKICLGVCVVGAIMILSGQYIQSDLILVVGAMFFSITFSAIVVKDLIEYFTRKA